MTESAVAKPQVSAPQAIAAKATESQAKLPTNKAVYGLQHVLIPQWTFFSDGNFYDELQAGKSEKLKQIA
ncbi:hypothetical protein ACI3QN_13840, partial [Propionibacterium freudenreichii]|uniref:hypothetical protein n=1 Tax=Propionibacterium freudenreichii TaxID=1744 RepID=UPI003851B133